MRLRTVPALVVGLAVLRSAGAQSAKRSAVEITNEPSHHLVLANSYVRVFDVRVAPHATTLVHRHRDDYLFVTLGDADITSTRPGEPPVRLTPHDGDVRFTAGRFAHSAANNADQPFHNTTIELRHPATHAAACTDRCAAPTPCPVAGDASAARTCPVAQVLATADAWQVSSVTLPPSGDVTVPDTAGPVLVVGVSAVQLSVTGERGGVGIRGGPGVVGWIAAPAHAGSAARPAARIITNAGTAPARVVLLEFRRARPRGARPTGAG